MQHECIPQAILGMDVICQAKSGMGKTAVFVLSTLQQIEPVAGQVAALVLCHTRELAYQVRGIILIVQKCPMMVVYHLQNDYLHVHISQHRNFSHIYNIVFLFPNIPLCFFSLKILQICHEFERFSTYLPDIRVAVFYGGVNVKTHKDLLKNECPHIVVGTPGRILALGRDKDLGLKNVRHFILDECDKMLESLGMAFIFFFLLPLGSEIQIFAIVLFSFQCLLCC